MSKSAKITTDKIAEQIYRLSLKIDFQEDLKSLRNMAEVPPSGLSSKEAAERWFWNYFMSKGTESQRQRLINQNFFIHLKEVLLKYHLSPGAIWALQNFVITNNKYDFFPSTACEIDLAYQVSSAEILPLFQIKLSSLVETDWWRSGQPFVKIFIPQGLSLPDVQKYLKKCWPDIKSYFAKYPQKRIRRLSNKDRDEKIFELWSKTSKELGLKKGEYREIIIERIMKQKYGVDVSSENVKMIAHRQKKLRNS